MRQIKRRWIGSLLLIVISGAMQAQQIAFQSKAASLLNDSVHIELRMNINTLFIDADEAVIFTPVLKGSTQVLDLPPVIACGKKGYRLLVREHSLQEEKKHPYSVIVRNKQAFMQSVNYEAKVPYASWMGEAMLCLRNEYKNYRKAQYLSFDTIMTTVGLGRRQVTPETDSPAPTTDSLPLSRSLQEAGKANEAITEIQLRIDYCGGRYDVQVLNAQHLNRAIEQNSREIKEISIIGYASPEGEYTQNENLAKQRAENLKRYICRVHNISPLDIHTGWVAENWQGLSCLLLQSQKPYREEVLKLIEQYGIFCGREKRLMAYKSGVPYKEMLQEWFPLLRYAVIQITYK